MYAPSIQAQFSCQEAAGQAAREGGREREGGSSGSTPSIISDPVDSNMSALPNKIKHLFGNDGECAPTVLLILCCFHEKLF